MPGSRGARALLLFVLAVVVFLPALGAGFIWDDDEAITRNTLLHSPEGLRAIWSNPSRIPQHHYWPMVYTTFWIEYQVWELNPAGYHFTNILLHALNAVLLWMLLGRAGVAGAWLGAAIFAVHPVHVESVAWVVERKDVLSAFFYLISALLFLSFHERRRALFYVLSLLAFVLAMLSKSIAVTLPLALLLWIWWRSGGLTRRDLVTVAPFVVLAAVIAVFDVVISRSQVVASDLGLVERVLLAGRITWFYAGKIVWPVNLMAIYPRWEIQSASTAQLLYPVGVLVVLATVFGVRRRIGAGPLVAALFFLITLAPLLGFLDFEYMVHSFVADRYLYLPSIGLIALVGAGIARLFQHPRLPSRAVKLLALMLIVILGTGTWLRAQDFRDLETLFRDNLDRNPNAFAAHNNLAAHLLDHGRPEEAKHHFQEAIRLQPDYPIAHHGLAFVFTREGKLEEAVAEYRKAIRLRPDYLDAHINLGATLIEQGNLDAAIESLRRALELAPTAREARMNLAQAHMLAARESISRGDIDGSWSHFRESLQLDPSNHDLRLAHARLLARVGERDQAIAEYERILEAKPDHALAREELRKLR